MKRKLLGKKDKIYLDEYLKISIFYFYFACVAFSICLMIIVVYLLFLLEKGIS